jgi:cytochrome c biogenesis protein CcdA
VYVLDISYIIPLIATYALIDSIDPCFFAIYASVLVSLGLNSPGKILKAGLVFIIAVGLGYFTLGFLLRNVLSWVNLERSSTAPLIILYGLVAILYGAVKLLRKSSNITELVCKEDTGTLCRVVKRIGLSEIRDLPSVLKYTYLVVLGLVMSLTILPCSAGLYIAYILITANTPMYLWIPLTILYILVFVSPLVLVTMGLVGLFKAFKAAKYMVGWSISERYSELLRIIGGVIATTTGIYLYYYS